MEIYQRVRRACHVEGMSQREAARQFGLHRTTIKKILGFSIPPGYRRTQSIKSPKLDGFTGHIDAILADDRQRPRKHTTPPGASWNACVTSTGLPAATPS